MAHNSPQELTCLMNNLCSFGLAAGLDINVDKSTLFSLKQCDWHAILWPGQINPTRYISEALGISNWLECNSQGSNAMGLGKDQCQNSVLEIGYLALTPNHTIDYYGLCAILFAFDSMDE